MWWRLSKTVHSRLGSLHSCRRRLEVLTLPRCMTCTHARMALSKPLLLGDDSSHCLKAAHLAHDAGEQDDSPNIWELKYLEKLDKTRCVRNDIVGCSFWQSGSSAVWACRTLRGSAVDVVTQVAFHSVVDHCLGALSKFEPVSDLHEKRLERHGHAQSARLVGLGL